MGISRLYNRIALTSPYVEILLRRIYWNNVDKLGKYNPYKAKKTECHNNVNFEIVKEWLRNKGVSKGDILIVHSGYGELEKTGLSPDEIIDQLMQLIGESGTLVMPVIRRYKDYERAKKEGKDVSKMTFKYNVKKSLITSGMLPYALLQRQNARISHHPFNPLCAIGPHAEDMMRGNLDGLYPSPHGPNSCWKYCHDHGAKICSIGADLEHHNTMLHVGEEGFDNWRWSKDIWYDQFSFEVIDEQKNSKFVIVSNRKDEWGQQHLAGLNLASSLKKEGIMSSDKVEGITVGFLESKQLISYLRNKNKNGYPYYVFPWENVKNFK